MVLAYILVPELLAALNYSKGNVNFAAIPTKLKLKAKVPFAGRVHIISHGNEYQ